MDLNYMDEEERESRFGKKALFKGLLFVCIVGMIGMIIFFFRNAIWKKEAAEEKKKITERVETDFGFSSEHFIIDDSKEGKRQEENLKQVPEKEGIKEKFLSQKGSRICEFDCIELPEIVESGDLIDVRLSLADGRNYTVLSGKKVGDYYVKDTKKLVWLLLNEVEILRMESALSDLELFSRAKLYAVILKEPEEEEGRINYPVNGKSEKLIKDAIKKNGSLSRLKPLTDDLLDEDRMKYLEREKEESWKETATYWNQE